ncbi:MAG: hypothetical protein Roseis2KO_39710 [Roseivirga sp.]
MAFSRDIVIDPRHKPRRSWFLIIVTVLLCISVFIDIYIWMSIASNRLAILIIAELIMIIFAAGALKGNDRAYNAVYLFFFVRSFSLYLNSFSFWTKGGYEITLTLNNLVINVIPFLVTIGFLWHFHKRFGKWQAQSPVVFSSTLIFIILIVGTFTNL